MIDRMIGGKNPTSSRNRLRFIVFLITCSICGEVKMCSKLASPIHSLPHTPPRRRKSLKASTACSRIG